MYTNFQNWKSQHNKLYTQEEESFRYTVFKKTVEFIHRYNSENTLTTLATNEFSDLTNEEWAASYLSHIPT
jgi:hypothetical protein